MDSASYFTFVAAAGLLAIVPGPGVLFVLAQTARGGKGAGLGASLGTALGGLFHVVAGAVGLSAIVYASALAFEVVKVLGALYLFWLGWKAWREKGDADLALDGGGGTVLRRESFTQGIVTEALNPKTALFFLALIPQFVDPAGSVAAQFALLGTTSVVLNTAVDVVAVLSSNLLIARLRRSRSAAVAFRKVSAVGYVALGLLALRATREVRA